MAKVHKIDRALSTRLDEFEQRMFLLKIQYEKFFNGFERVEPTRERDKLRRYLRDLLNEPVKNTGQKHRLEGLKSRLGSYEYYWTRNLRLFEQGKHPRQKFKAKLADRDKQELLRMEAEARARLRKAKNREQQNKAFERVYERYLEKRKACGQSSEVPFETMATMLRDQAKQIRNQYKVKSIRFKVVVEDGQAKVKAIPVS